MNARMVSGMLFALVVMASLFYWPPVRGFIPQGQAGNRVDSLGGADSVAFSPQVLQFPEFRSFGDMSPMRVRLTNARSTPFVIKNVYAGCGCVQAKVLGSSVVPANGYVDVEVSIDLASVKPGSYEYQLAALPAAANDVRVTGRVQYSYRPEYRSSLRRVTLHADKRDAPALGGRLGQQAVLLFFEVEGDVSLLGIASSAAHVEPSWRRVDADEGRQAFEVTVSLKNEAPVGNSVEQLEVRTSHERYQRIVIPVEVSVSGRFRRTPDKVVLRDLIPGARFVREVQLAADTPMRIRSLESSSTLLSASVKPSGTPRESTIVLSGTTPEPLGGASIGRGPIAYRETIRIVFDEPEGETDLLEVYGTMSLGRAVQVP